MIKSYTELMKIKSFNDRLKYLQCFSNVGDMTFGSKRYLNQILYHDSEWKRVRRRVILRDSDGEYSLDLGHEDHPFVGEVYVHHINPITEKDILERKACVFDMENLICCSFNTHNSIHYGRERKPDVVVTRKKNDTCPWRE